MVREAIRLMESNLESPMRLSAVARTLGWSLSHLKAVFTREVGISPADFYRRRRLLEACERLDSSPVSITEVAHSLGFADAQNFSTTFKRVMGVTPQAFRKSAVEMPAFSDDIPFLTEQEEDAVRA